MMRCGYGFSRATAVVFTRRIMATFLVFLFNPLLLTLLFWGTPFQAWKQVAWVISVFFLLFISRRVMLPKSISQKAIVWFWIAVMICSLFAAVSLFKGYGLTRCLFAFVTYLFGIPFVIYPFLYVRENRVHSMINLFLILSLILNVGLILDHFSGIFNILQLPAGQIWLEARSVVYRRASFFFESPTALVGGFLFLNLWAFYRFFAGGAGLGKIMAMTSILLVVPAAFFTGSRQVLYVLVLFISLSWFSSIIRFNMRKIVSNIFLVLFLAIPAVFIFRMLFFESGVSIALLARLSGLSNLPHVTSWQAGLAQLAPANIYYWFFGHGLGSCMGQHSLPGAFVHSNFESTVWATFYEAGFFGWFIVFGPILWGLSVLFRQSASLLRDMFIVYLVAYIIVSFISPSGLHFVTLISVYIVLGCALNIQEIDVFALRGKSSPQLTSVSI